MTSPVIQIQGQVQVEGPVKSLILPTGFQSAFIVGDTTPSVLNVNYWVARNTSPITITDFDNGQDGQTIYILGDGVTTVAQNANVVNASGNPTLLQANAIYTYTQMLGVWYQMQGTGGSGGLNGVGIKLVDWSFTPNPTPAALSRTAWTASASASGSGDAPSNAIDGNSATRWATGAVVVPNTTYFALDMGSAISCAGMQINNYSDTGDFPTTGNVQWSDDGITYTTAVGWTSTNIVGATLTANWTAVSHRYWRLLATSTPAVGTNWFSIYEINFFATPFVYPTWHQANETWQQGSQQAVWFRGVYAKTLANDNFGIGIGLDTSNMYALYHAGGSANILLVAIVAGVSTTLQTIAIDNDANPHELEIEVITPNGPLQNNMITVRVGRYDNPRASASYLDNTLDLTSGTAGQFLQLATIDTIARGCNYFQLPATLDTSTVCTIATGGTITQVGLYREHVFTSNGSFTITQGGVGVLGVIIAGGGGGAWSQNGGGGGAIVFKTYALTPGSHTITIGAGGIARTGGDSSYFDSDFAVGGGAGSSVYGGTSGVGSGVPSALGGKTGGSTAAVSDGTNSASGGGGGGGASQDGATGTYSGSAPAFIAQTGKGGDGYLSGTFGVAGGGQGGCSKAGGGSDDPLGQSIYGGGGSGADGSVNTGGGGGGAVDAGPEGEGGSGIVFVYYLYDPTKCG